MAIFSISIRLQNHLQCILKTVCIRNKVKRYCSGKGQSGYKRLSFNINWVIFQLFQGKNKLHFDEMIMMYILFKTKSTRGVGFLYTTQHGKTKRWPTYTDLTKNPGVNPDVSYVSTNWINTETLHIVLI